MSHDHRIIAVVAIRIMCNSLRDTCFRWISNTSWMEHWMCSMVAAASGSLQSHQRSLQTSRLIVKGVKMWQKILLPYLNPLWWFENLDVPCFGKSCFSHTLNVTNGVTASGMWRKVLLYEYFFFRPVERNDAPVGLAPKSNAECLWSVCILI